MPCVTLRENTERPITISEGTNVLAGTNPDTIVRIARNVMVEKASTTRRPALWDGKAAQRIVDLIVTQLN